MPRSKSTIVQVKVTIPSHVIALTSVCVCSCRSFHFKSQQSIRGVCGDQGCLQGLFKGLV